MAPDFEYFLRLRPITEFSHTLGGLFWFCVPAGLFVLALWEFMAREPVRHLLALPPAAPTQRDGAWWVKAAVAVLLGAITHLAWDGFTHGGYWGADLMPWLREPAFIVMRRTIPWYNLLQHVSTLLGGLVVTGWLAIQLQREGAWALLARPGWRWGAWLFLAVVSLAAGWLNVGHTGVPAGYWVAQVWLGRVAVGAMVAFALLLLVYATAWHGTQRRRTR